MANDRVWLRCKACGGRTLLAKYHPSSGLTPWQNCDAVPLFLLEHLACHPANAECPTDLGGDPGLGVVTDDGPPDGGGSPPAVAA